MNIVELDVGNLKRWLDGDHRNQRHQRGLGASKWLRLVLLRPARHVA